MKAVITVIGTDKPGIIYHVSKILFEAGINILDITQTIMQDIFTMVTVVDISTSTLAFDALSQSLEGLGAELGLSIRIQHEDLFNSMHRI